MDANNDFTDAEIIAKEKFMRIIIEGARVACDIDQRTTELPSWYDAELFRRGQQYFYANRIGILQSNLTGLITLLAEPKGLRTLMSTGRSGTPQTAKVRYISTLGHLITWYDIDNSPGKRSQESWSNVRKLHYFSSQSASQRGIGCINQMELAFTAFGFMGYVLLRPHVLGISYNNRDDQKAFAHLWAVNCYMIGVKDEYNICLLPFDSLIIICQMIVRYLLMPQIQIETPEFRQMTDALIQGMKQMIPYLNLETELFSVKSLLMVPGYQYKLDLSKEELCRTLLTQEDIDRCNDILHQVSGRHATMTVDIPLISVARRDDNFDSSKQLEPQILEWHTHLRIIMGLSPDQDLIIKFVQYEREWLNVLNDSKFHESSSEVKSAIFKKYVFRRIYETRICKFIIEKLFSIFVYLNRRKT